MSRNRARAEDYARRHGVPRAYGIAAELIADSEVDAVYIATPPGSHLELARAVAAAGKPCLVEKPMALTYAECVEMRSAFAEARVPLWVAYYRRALPRFLTIRALLEEQAIGTITSANLQTLTPVGDVAAGNSWRVDPAVSGGGLFFDVGSHAVDLLDFLIGPITKVCGIARNTANRHAAEDVTVATFDIDRRVAATGLWNFNADRHEDRLTLVGSCGRITTSVLEDSDVVVEANGHREVLPIRNPEHVHQPLIQTVVDELLSRGRCPSTAETAARASWVLEQCVQEYYQNRVH